MRFQLGHHESRDTIQTETSAYNPCEYLCQKIIGERKGGGGKRKKERKRR